MEPKKTVSELSLKAIAAYESWLMTVDGTNLSKKTSAMYATCMKKIIGNACKGSLTELNEYHRWSEPFNYMSEVATWRKEDTPLLLKHFAQHLCSKEKLAIRVLRSSPIYDFLIGERKFSEKQVMNKLQWIRKSLFI